MREAHLGERLHGDLREDHSFAPTEAGDERT